MNLIHTLRLCP